MVWYYFKAGIPCADIWPETYDFVHLERLTK